MASVFGYDEAMASVVHGRWVITSPNMPLLPFFPIDRVSVRLRSDGKLGDEDFTLAPQIFTNEYAHRILVRRHPAEGSTETVMWWTPCQDEFQPLSRSSYHSLGRLRSDRFALIDAMTWNLSNRAYNIIGSNPGADWAALEALIANMRHGVMRLKHSPFTYRELIMDVAQTQRLYLDALAMCDYVEDKWANVLQAVGPVCEKTKTEYIGAWTADPAVVQKLHHAGVPVYFVRSLPTVAPCSYDRVLQNTWCRDDRVVTSDMGLPERYNGVPGRNQHASASQLNQYGGLENYFFKLGDDKNVHAVGSRGKMSKPVVASNSRRSRNKKRQATGAPVTSSPPIRDKWVEIRGDFMPDTLPFWSGAMLAVDRADRQADVAPKEYTGYRFPDPGMLVFSTVRREKNLFNWLIVCDATIRRVMHDVESPAGIPRGFSNELWRMIIGVEFTDRDKNGATDREFAPDNIPNARSSSHSERRQAAIAIFGQPPDGHNFNAVRWRNHDVRWGTFFEHDPLLVQEVMWDYDLIAADRYFCGAAWLVENSARRALISRVVGTENCLFVDEFPLRGTGISSSDVNERHEAYKYFDRLMARWPSGPGDAAQSTETNLESVIALRFCSSFVRAFGRPPILPKLLPCRTDLRGSYVGGYEQAIYVALHTATTCDPPGGDNGSNGSANLSPSAGQLLPSAVPKIPPRGKPPPYAAHYIPSIIERTPSASHPPPSAARSRSILTLIGNDLRQLR
ncbi:hypothetical protein HWV62_33879 [Athelia sp. TMB]|nr:hypothetical protein HWV62_33879 [Athelia sp. TMB]